MIIAGIDEAGRGCLCGALFIAGVIGEESLLLSFGAKDSKKMSEKARKQVYSRLIEAQRNKKIGISLIKKEAWEIDSLGLSAAMKEGLESVLLELYEIAHTLIPTLPYTQNKIPCIFDGNTSFGAQFPKDFESKMYFDTLIQADSKLPSVACASIIAKVSKDSQMYEIDKLYPHYHLAKNKGYGTAEHKEAIAHYGYCPHHRKSFKLKQKGIYIQEKLFNLNLN